MSDPAWELPEIVPLDFPANPAPLAEWKTTPGDPVSPDGVDRDGGILVPNAAGADDPVTWVPLGFNEGLDELSAVLSLLPIAGTAKDIIEGTSGRDIVTGEKLSTQKRLFLFAAAAGDILGAGRFARSTSITVRVVRGVGEGAGKYNDVGDVGTIVF